MRSQQHIKTFLFSLLVLACYSVNAQRDTLEYLHSPYRTETNLVFELGLFKRGFSNERLAESLDSLEEKPRTTWSRRDSLRFAQISLRTGNTALSDYYFDHLNVKLQTETGFWYDHLMIYYLSKDYYDGLALIQKDSPMMLEFSTIYFFKKIFEAKIKQSEDSKWHKTHLVFDWIPDTSLNRLEKDDPEFIEFVITPLKNLEFVLQKVIAYVHVDDPIIANACREMGHVIEAHLNLTHAYIAYGLGRNYNKWDKALMEDLKSVKAKMTQRNLKIPNFRKYFPRIEEWRFDYKVLKEKVIFEQNDTLVYKRPETMSKKEPPLLSFPAQYIVVAGLLFLILLLMLILKPKK